MALQALVTKALLATVVVVTTVAGVVEVALVT